MSIIDALNDKGGVNGLLDPAGTARAIQRALDQQVANMRGGANPSNSPSMANSPAATTDPYQLLQQQLFSQINSIPNYSTPIDQLRQMATQQAAAQYDPAINALAGNMRAQQDLTKRNQSDAKGMYGSLAKDLASQIPQITAQMRQAQDEAGNRYQQASQQSQQDYSQQAAQQQQILSQLGLQSAQQATQGQSQADQQYFQNQNALSKNQALDALQEQGNADTGYQRGIADSSQLAGTNAVEQLQRQLQDYLGQANNQMGTLQAQKSGDVESILSQLMNSDQQHAQTQRQNEIDNMLKMFNFQLAAQKASNSASQSSNSPFRGTSGPQGAANYLAESLGADRSNTASQILQLINDTMSDPNVVAGKHAELDSKGNPVKDQITGKPVTLSNNDQYIEDLLRGKMEAAPGGYGTGDINSAINALLAYMGKLR